ncbi:GNAT family N-acetyltransferase [Nonomuraea sp. KM88]|uniref:GNAT family N-acetyltransferase n=1 Tax=Nonomuraea sp. KM88 TaxID=3457427 RepID=UPI003FCED876
MTPDVDLLAIEIGVIWRLDDRGRLPGPEDLVVGVAADDMTAAVGPDVPGALAARLLDLVARGLPSSPGQPPEVLERCRALLGEATVSGGPCYLIPPPPVPFDAPAAEVLRSDDPAHAERVRPLRPANWARDEWHDLLDGRDGAPWAMVAADDQVAAVCHTARLTAAGAEAGVWTAPAFRGRGLAAATTATWAGLLPGTRLFYSTGADNHSSQRVAARLGLRSIGWLWKLTR